MRVPTAIVKDIEYDFKLDNDNEREFRFGYFKGHTFIPYIHYNDFNILKNTLGNYKYIEKEVILYDNNIRSVNGSLEYKERVKNIDFNIEKYEIRYSNSIESEVDIKDIGDPKFTRNKKIYVFEFNNYDIELSNVNEKFECEIEFKKVNLNGKDIFDPIKKIINILDEYYTLVKIINNIFGKDYKTLYYPINKPKNLKRHHISSLKDYYVYFDKLNGIRFFLLECKEGTYIVNRTTYNKLNDKKHDSISIYDIEYIKDKPYVFDVLIHAGKDVRRMNFFERFKYVLNSEYTHIQYSTDYNDISYSKGCDGIIFTPIDADYFNTRTYKYKPVEELTIDFLVDGDKLCVYEDGLQIYREGVYGFEEYDKQIVECKWDGKKFIPYRVRHDKVSPNHKNVADDVVNDLLNPINLKDIKI